MRHRCLREKDCVIHDCPECKSGGAVCHCVDCKKKPAPCGCDNCEIPRRFGGGVYIANTAICKLCGRKRNEHPKDSLCPPKRTEWELPCGVKVKLVAEKQGTEEAIHLNFSAGSSLGRFVIDSNHYDNLTVAIIPNTIPSLIKILEEIENKER